VNLGWRHLKGQGVNRDDALAATRLFDVAEQGDVQALHNLGYMYAAGRGVEQNQEKATDWYRKAAEQDHALALINLGSMYLKGRGVPRDEAQAAALFQKAAAQGDERAKNNLALVDRAQSLTFMQLSLKTALVAAVVAFAILIVYSIVRDRTRPQVPAP
jgi:hypothetical protein